MMASEELGALRRVRPPRVLVVSPDHAWRRAARALLDLDGYVTTGHADLGTAFGSSMHAHFDVVLVDATGDLVDAARIAGAASASEGAPEVVIVVDDPATTPPALTTLRRSGAPELLLDAIARAAHPADEQALRVV